METRTRGLGASRSYALVGMVLLALMLAIQPVRAATVTGDNLDESIAAAKTAEEHEAIATYFKGKADDARAQVKAHEGMLKAYGRWGSGKEKGHHANHCKDAIKSYENIAKDYDALAKEHETMAKKAK